mmetsp:Transcript_1700/g.2620  ORF Transcript_1700/g.2620 Transcript_1700/m.2620 type:complete len:142 (-) Transcript_1700:519-944(-)
MTSYNITKKMYAFQYPRAQKSSIVTNRLDSSPVGLENGCELSRPAARMELAPLDFVIDAEIESKSSLAARLLWLTRSTTTFWYDRSVGTILSRNSVSAAQLSEYVIRTSMASLSASVKMRSSSIIIRTATFAEVSMSWWMT